MNKVLTTLSISLLLTGCFDDASTQKQMDVVPKKDIVTKTLKNENTNDPKPTLVADEVKKETVEAPSLKAENIQPEKLEQEKTVVKETSSTPLVVPKMEAFVNTEKTKRTTGELARTARLKTEVTVRERVEVKVEKSLPIKAEAPKSASKKATKQKILEKKRELVKEKEPTVVETKEVKPIVNAKPSRRYLAYHRVKAGNSVANSEEDLPVSNFSMEELRLGSPRSQTMREIELDKSQCRYPLMTRDEQVAYNCLPKTVRE